MPNSEIFLLLLALLALFCLVGLAVYLHLGYWSRKLAVKMAYELEERLTTPDGAAIELRRLPPHEPEPATRASADPLAPARVPPSALPPILLVHGLGANHRNIDFLPDHSLARHLSARGRDVWLLTLRSGLERLARAQQRKVRFPAMVEYDLPLAIDTVLQRTGQPALDYVGFSMGGMLLYAALGHSVDESKLRRAVLIGSPAVIKSPWPVPRWVLRVPLPLIPTFRFRLLGRLGAFAVEWASTPFHRMLLNPENCAPGISRHALVNLAADVHGGLNLDFAAWALSQDGVLRLGEKSVLERMAPLKLPVLFLAGSADRMAPPAAVRAAFDAWGTQSTDVVKRFVLLGREHGARGDYGHGDLAIGRHVRDEVFEPVAAFLEAPA